MGNLVKTCVFLLLTATAHAEVRKPDFTFRFEQGNTWEMSGSLQYEFAEFLSREMDDLKVKIPQIYWPEINDQTQARDIFRTALHAGSPSYQNREFQCSFVNKILAATTGAAHQRFSALTQNGSICIQRDLPRTEWTKFTEGLVEFFWQEKWISNRGEMLSLEDLTSRAFGSAYRRPAFHVSERIELDGYGWGYSSDELALIQNTPDLARYASIAATYDVHSSTHFTALGPNIATILGGNPFEALNIIQLSSQIYVSNAWGPADLVELLVHEYGHVVQGELTNNFTWDAASRSLVVRANSVHNESFAESTAWMILRDIYDSYPETRFFHLAKLQLFFHTRPRDSHLVGAAVVHRLFHSASDGTFAELIEYAQAEGFREYLERHGFAGGLINLGERKPFIVPVYFSQESL